MKNRLLKNEKMILWTKVIFVIGTVLFLFNLGDIAPGLGRQHDIFWLVSAVVFLILSIYLFRKFTKNPSKDLSILMLIIIIGVNVTGYSLHHIYREKYDKAIAVYTSGDIHIRKKDVKTELFTVNAGNEVFVSNFDVDVEIQGTKGSSPYLVEVGEDYLVNVKCSYMLRGEKYEKNEIVPLEISSDSFPTFKTELELKMSNSESANIQIEYERVRDFWSVLLEDID